MRLPTEETRYFDFAWPSFCNTPRSLDWLGVAQHQVNYTHMQLYQLQKGESLSFFLSTLVSLTSARALVLINVYDGYKLDEKIRPEMDGPSIPTMVVSHRTGQELVEIVRMYEREVQVRVHRGGAQREEGGGEGERERERGPGDPDEWDVIQSPLGTVHVSLSISTVRTCTCTM